MSGKKNNKSLRNITIAGQKIAPGEHAEIDLAVAKLPTHTMVELPVHIFRSDRPGPVMLLTAGVHGDEVNGTEAIRRMIRNGQIVPDYGTVVAMPIVNVFGFLHHSRDLPDGKDLNRCFPGSKNGSLGSVIAWTLMNEILPIIDMGVDFHTGGAQISNYPQVRCAFEHPECVGYAMAFAPPFILNSKFIEKSFRKEAYRKGKHIIVYEGGESFRFDELSIREAINGVRRLMHHLGMREHKGHPHEPHLFARTHWVRSRNSGLFKSMVNSGDPVKKNQVLAVISDPFGQVEMRIKSPENGYIVGINNKPVVNLGEALFHIGVL